MSSITLTINDQTVTVPVGTSLLKACETAGFRIPTLCHDPRLEATGSCRICVVEVQGARTLQASCSTPVSPGMVVQTHSPRVLSSRKATLELLWSSHPNDCLTCGKAGDCRLQDHCHTYGIDAEGEAYPQRLQTKRDESNPFFTFDRSKCILCGQCVNVCGSLVGFGAIDFTERGHETRVAHPFDAGMTYSDCVSCGSCVAACPTGALMERTRNRFRTWELEKKVRTTCAYCGVGCQTDLAVKDNRVVRVDPAPGTPNHGLLCVKGKFGYKFIDSPERLTAPLIRKEGVLQEATWEEALALVAEQLQKTKAQHGPDSLGALVSARCTNEENYLMQKLFRAVIGTNNVDHCARL